MLTHLLCDGLYYKELTSQSYKLTWSCQLGVVIQSVYVFVRKGVISNTLVEVNNRMLSFFMHTTDILML